jgi:hypothetical protein
MDKYIKFMDNYKKIAMQFSFFIVKNIHTRSLKSYYNMIAIIRWFLWKY